MLKLAEKKFFNSEAESEIEWLKEFILGIRKIRGEMNISPRKPLNCFIKNFSPKDKAFLENNKSIIFALAKLENIEMLEKNKEEPKSAIALVGEMKILIPLAGLIDKEAEKERLNKEIDKLIKLQTQFSTKLNNEKFISGAPSEVIKKEQDKLKSVENSLKELEEQIKKIFSI